MPIYEDIFGETRSHHTINSKVKGNSNERACAKPLGKWVGVKFVRVIMSGGLRRENTDNTCGDLIPDTKEKEFEFPFVIETKHLKTLTFSRTLAPRSIFFTIWKQVSYDSIRANKIPLALLRSNGMPEGEYYLVLEAGQGGAIMSLHVPILFSGGNGTFSLIGFKFSDVMRLMPYQKFARAVKKGNFVSKSKVYAD